MILILTYCSAEKALATLQGRPIPGIQQHVSLTLSPYPSTTPPTPLPPPNASPRLVKQLPSGFTDSQLYDLFRPFGALASVRAQAPIGKDNGIVEFWREEDAREAEEAMHCADVEGQNIVVQIYQPRRAPGVASEFSPNAPTFVPSGSVFPYPTQVCRSSFCSRTCVHERFSILRLAPNTPLPALLLMVAPLYLSMALDSKSNWLLCRAPARTAIVVSSIRAISSSK